MMVNFELMLSQTLLVKVLETVLLTTVKNTPIMFNIYLKGIFENNMSPTPASLNQLEATNQEEII